MNSEHLLFASGRKLTLDPPWSVPRSLQAVQQLTRLVHELHERGLLHGRIDFAMIEVGEGESLLLPPVGTPIRIGGEDCELEYCPPELMGNTELLLPLELEKAKLALHQAGLNVDPRRIDVYQLAVLLCQMVTGKSVREYANSLRRKASVPDKVREILDRGLGFDSPDRIQTCNLLADAIEKALTRLSTVEPIAADHPSTAETIITSNTDLPLAEANQGIRRLPESPLPRLVHFQLLERIGRGGMGEVYRAHDEKLNRIVAVKVLRKDLSSQESFIRRFSSEAKSLARLPHPNLLPLYFTGEDQGERFFVMRYVEGESLAVRLRRSPALTVAEVLDITVQCVSALAAAHEEGVIHRDVKPANVLLERNSNQVYLVDFGLAKFHEDQTRLTQTGVVMGTVEYLSPEQARGEGEIDQRADLYSLGVMLFEMLAGKLPFAADSAVGWIFQHAHEQTFPLESIVEDLPAELVSLVESLLAKKPEDRPADGREVLAVLLPLQNEEVRMRQLNQECAAALSASEEHRLLPLEPEVLRNAGMLQRLSDRAATLFRRHRPDWLEKLQSTEQQVDDAIARYERQQRRLLPLQAQGHELLNVLQLQLRAALAEKDESATKSASNTRELREQISALTEQIAQLDAEVAKVGATLLRLKSSRDALLARLEIAKPKSSGSQENRSLPGMSGTALSIGGVVVAMIAAVWWWRTGLSRPDAKPIPSAKSTEIGTTAEKASVPLISPPANQPQKSAPDPLTTEVAETVFQLGGKLKIHTNNDEFEVASARELPSSYYSIRQIDLLDCKGVTLSHTQRFAKLASITKINFQGSGIDDAILVPIGSLPQLQYLYCGNTNVTGSAFADFPEMASLKQIALAHASKGEYLPLLEKFPNLDGLFLGWSKLNDAGLQMLPELPKVNILILEHTLVSGPGLAHLTRFPKLETLKMRHTPLTDEGLNNLPASLPLKKLDLRETNIGDASVSHLRKFTGLRLLELQQTNLTPAGIAALQQALPECQINFEAIPAVN